MFSEMGIVSHWNAKTRAKSCREINWNWFCIHSIDVRRAEALHDPNGIIHPDKGPSVKGPCAWCLCSHVIRWGNSQRQRYRITWPPVLIIAESKRTHSSYDRRLRPHHLKLREEIFFFRNPFFIAFFVCRNSHFVPRSFPVAKMAAVAAAHSI